MRLNKRVDVYLVWGGLFLVASACVLAVCFASEPQAEKSTSEKSGGNSKCYVCHASLKTEDITTIHLDMDITCDQCHGPSIEHMHDEMLMTKPDLLFGRAEVQKMCSNPMCHKPGGDRSVYGRQDHMDHEAVKAFLKKWLHRVRPNGRFITSKAVCTDCHGTHNIVKDVATESQEQSTNWITAFNGRDLTGWRPSGDISWEVKHGRLVAAVKPNGKGGTLWTDAVYEDYLLSVTFRATWPIHAGIWLRAAGTERGPRVEIFENHKASAFTGSLWVPGKGLALTNLRQDLVDRQSWNTISVKVRGKRFQVWLNGEEVGAIWVSGPAKGNIGLHIETHPRYKAAELYVREVLIQKLGEQEKADTKSGTKPAASKLEK
ncbi:MAG: DUF1080 domain-containing protein [Planctomycetes bacterium]|nr:DUF1080 domain-containing protein [Planctomycetota bacterium]